MKMGRSLESKPIDWKVFLYHHLLNFKRIPKAKPVRIATKCFAWQSNASESQFRMKRETQIEKVATDN